MVISKVAVDNQHHIIDDVISGDTPVLRIGLTEYKDSIEFKSTGRFSVYNNEGIAFLKNISSSSKWRVKIEQSYNARYSYNILLGKFLDITEAQDLSYSLLEKGLGVRIKTLGDKFYYRNKVLNDNSQHWVIVDEFNSAEEAKSFANEVLSKYQFEIIKEKIKEPGAILEIFDSEYERLGEAENVIRIIPESKEVEFYIYDLTIDDGFQMKYNKCRAFRGVLEFRSNDAGKLTIISETPLEEYIAGVIALQMKEEIPDEALKAQAITVRSKIIAGLGINHYNDPYDICAGSHCQVFTGFSVTSEDIVNAIKETLGKVLVYDKKVFEANYSLICGGCTEKHSLINSGIISTLETNVFDNSNKSQGEICEDLSDEHNICKWIDSEPDVFCNLSGNNELVNLHKYFRWEVSYSRKELEDIISEKESKIIGTLYDIIPIERSFSGRLIEIEIIASNKNLVIKGEMNIRKILARNMLNSSCFYVKKELDEDGIPILFSFCGAGMGHGVGLCQTGAVIMAQKGFKVNQILNHYFKGTKIKKVY